MMGWSPRSTISAGWCASETGSPGSFEREDNGDGGSVPDGQPGHVLIATVASLVLAGTERMLVEFGRKSLIGKARHQPDKVRQVLDKVKTDGVAATIESVRSRLEEPMALGYCNVGRVIDVGKGVTGRHRAQTCC